MFRAKLRELGHIEGKNIVYESRSAEGNLDRFPALADELIRLKVDVLVATSTTEALTFRSATKTIPIVFNIATDPVADGLVHSYARPGGNITGLTIIAIEIAGKRLELFKEAVPKLARVAVLYDPAHPANVLHVKEVQAAAAPLGLTVQSWSMKSTDDFEKGLNALGKQQPDGLYVTGGPLLRAKQTHIAGFALKSRLPSVYENKEAVDAGGLLSYAPDWADQNRRMAIFVDKILKGAKPADLPVERPTKFELVINLKTAKQIGLTIPPNVLARADRVIR